jgi:hypothetical protein
MTTFAPDTRAMYHYPARSRTSLREASSGRAASSEGRATSTGPWARQIRAILRRKLNEINGFPKLSTQHSLSRSESCSAPALLARRHHAAIRRATRVVGTHLIVLSLPPYSES